LDRTDDDAFNRARYFLIAVIQPEQGRTTIRRQRFRQNTARRISIDDVDCFHITQLKSNECLIASGRALIGARNSTPLGQYDDSKLLNLGNNRWSFKPELGISKAWGPWTFEVAPSVTLFSDNTDFFGGNTFAQAPIYAVQGHILYTFRCGVWMALDGVYFAGGHTSLNGVKSDNEQRNTRAGFTVAFPVDRNNSLKLSASTGISTRTGSEFSARGIAWQYRWGNGY
jgi:hypothetical protein